MCQIIIMKIVCHWIGKLYEARTRGRKIDLESVLLLEKNEDKRVRSRVSEKAIRLFKGTSPNKTKI